MLTQKILLRFEPKKENILQALKEIQKEEGLISHEAIDEVASFFSVAPAQIYSVVSFYDQFKLEKDGNLVVEIKICDGANCVVKGAEAVIEEIESFFNQKAGDNFNGKLKIERASCLGFCLQGPIMIINEIVFEKVSPSKVDDILKDYLLVEN